MAEKTVVLTFDDSVKSQATFAAPLLKKYGFNATFFITEGFSFHMRKDLYMTWEEIKNLHDQGFEIGNHTQKHKNLLLSGDLGFLKFLRFSDFIWSNLDIGLIDTNFS